MVNLSEALTCNSTVDPSVFQSGISKGTELTTIDGLILVEELNSSTYLKTRYDGFMRVISCIQLEMDKSIPQDFVCVASGVLGATSDLFLGCGQHVLLSNMLISALFRRSAALIAINRLSNNDQVQYVQGDKTLYHVVLERRCLIQANGVWLSSNALHAHDPLPIPELSDAEARAAGECGLFVSRRGETRARRSALEML